MRAIVLGGSGFVGSHVADALADAGHETTVFDRAPAPWLRDDQRFVEGDLTDPESVRTAIEGQEVVYNFAGIADIDEARSRPVDTVKVNVLGNVYALEASVAAGVQRYVFASSIYVSSTAGSFYRASKQACEAYVEEYGREHGLAWTVLRYGTLYGRRANELNSVHRYLLQALRDRKIVATGTGEELREYIHVEDAARLSVQVLDPEYAGRQVVLTGHHPMRYRDLLELIREIVGPDVELELVSPDEGSPHYRITPYAFRPEVARKLVATDYVDIGQGLVDCLQEIHDRHLTTS